MHGETIKKVFYILIT